MKITQASLDLLKSCLTEKTTIIMSADNLDTVFQSHILEIGDNFVAIENRVPPAMIKQFISSKNFNFQAKMSRFTASTLNSDGVNILFPLSGLTEIEETRMAERFPFDDEERVICELTNPFDNKTILSKTVLDMSATGVSIRCPKPSRLFQPNQRFEAVKVIIDGEAYTKAIATVVYTRKLLDLSGKLRVQVGLKFETNDQQNEN